MGRNRKYKNPSREIVDGKSKQTKCYVTWSDMIKRCYSSKYQEKKPTYIGCSVCDDWKDYDNFYNWFQTHYREGFVLDKDILIQGNKEYSPSTCVFIPQYINTLLIKRDNDRGEQPIGVTYHKRHKKYQAMCSNGQGKQIYLGLFTDPLTAHLVYAEAKYAYIKDIAENALKIGEIDQRTHDAMLRYVIEMY